MPRVLGVDDWALKRGRTYGTILVDLEARHVIDLLPDRTSRTLAAWLRHRPPVAVIARDRSTEYAPAATTAAAHAREVADRWHLLVNVREMAERWLMSAYPRLRRLSTVADHQTAAAPATCPDGAAPVPPATLRSRCAGATVTPVAAADRVAPDPTTRSGAPCGGVADPPSR